MTCDCARVVVAFDVHVRPEPKRRPRFGNGRTYTDARTVAYENRIATACRDAMKGRPPHDGPVELACLFEQRNRRVADTDNLVKAISDAIEGIAFTNDRHVSRIRAGRVAGADVDRVSVAVIAKETP